MPKKIHVSLKIDPMVGDRFINTAKQLDDRAHRKIGGRTQILETFLAIATELDADELELLFEFVRRNGAAAAAGFIKSNRRLMQRAIRS